MSYDSLQASQAVALAAAPDEVEQHAGHGKSVAAQRRDLLLAKVLLARDEAEAERAR